MLNTIFQKIKYNVSYTASRATRWCKSSITQANGQIKRKSEYTAMFKGTQHNLAQPALSLYSDQTKCEAMSLAGGFKQHLSLSRYASVSYYQTRMGQPYHIVSPSPFPLFVGIVFFCTAVSFIFSTRMPGLFMDGGHWYFIVGLMSLISAWLDEVTSEELMGHHSIEVQLGFRRGIALFILSEAMLFVSFFWAFFHISFNPGAALGWAFPPMQLVSFAWTGIPLLNTFILLTSGVSLAIAHVLIKQEDAKNRLIFANSTVLQAVSAANYFEPVTKVVKLNAATGKIDTSWLLGRIGHIQSLCNLQAVTGLISPRKLADAAGVNVSYDSKQRYSAGRGSAAQRLLLTTYISRRYFVRFNYVTWTLDTVLRGFVFLAIQSVEYTKALYQISSSVYGSIFFALTGLHGAHVFIGAMLLLVSAIFVFTVHSADSKTTPFTSAGLPWIHRVAFDGAAWYWHFVDVVWLLVFSLVYFWGNASIPR